MSDHPGFYVSRHTPPLERFYKSVDRSSEHWLWLRPLHGKRYPTFMVDGRPGVLVHRWAYEHFHGPIPDGLLVDHRCAIKRCVNPDHLRLLTPAGNTLAYWREQRTMCGRGEHPMEGENILFVKNARTTTGVERRCRTCERDRQRRYYARHRQVT